MAESRREETVPLVYWKGLHSYASLFWMVLLGCRSPEAPELSVNAASGVRTVGRLVVAPTPAAGFDAGSGVFPTSHGRAPLFIPAGVPRPPFVLVLHALGGSGEQIERELGLATFAQMRGFAYSAPDGSTDAEGRRVWNAGSVCCNFSHRDVDDVGRLIRIIREAVNSFDVDPRRVFVVGYSNGGFMAHRLACEHASSIRGIVSMAAAGPSSAEPCTPTNPVVVLELHGDRDSVVPYRGGHLFGRSDLPATPSIERSLGVWAYVNGCEGALRFSRRFDLITSIPGPETLIGSYERCTTAPINLWKVVGGQHRLDLDIRAFDAVWQFLVDSAQAP